MVESAQENKSEAMVPEETVEQKQKRLARRSRLLGWLIFCCTAAVYRTLRLTILHEEGLDTKGKGAIFVTWHGRSLIPANVFRDRGYWALISLSKDGEIQNNIFQRFGFRTIRGSTGRGGVKGALQMARKVKEGGVLAFTPDGPRGPTHKVQHGVILMAEKSGVPIIPLGISVSRRWLATKSWDCYLLPKPFSKAFLVVGDPIYVSAGQDEEGRERIAERVGRAINTLEKEAEALAGYPDYPAEWSTDCVD